MERAEHAAAVASIMRRVAKGLKRAEEEHGYLRQDDYALYVMRVANAAGIKEVHVRNPKRAQEMSGDHYRRVDTPGLQSWVSMVVSDVHSSERHQHYV